MYCCSRGGRGRTTSPLCSGDGDGGGGGGGQEERLGEGKVSSYLQLFVSSRTTTGRGNGGKVDRLIFFLGEGQWTGTLVQPYHTTQHMTCVCVCVFLVCQELSSHFFRLQLGAHAA